MEKRSETIGKINIDLSYYSGEDVYSEGAVEDDLLAIVRDEPARRYNEIIGRRHTWNALYHLSDMRGNIVDFLPIQSKHRVLEIGAGCGAVTGALADKAAHVTCVELSYKRSLINAYRHRERDNIDIIVGNFEDIERELTEEYDYVFLIGVLEYAGSYITKKEDAADPYLSMLKRLTGHLAQGGEIVAGIENKYGMKYLSGCREDHTGGFYDGIEGYTGTDKVRTFSKNGLMKLAKNAGLRTVFYYPYPDYKLPAVIFSDERLPHQGELTDNIRNYDASRFVAFDEAKAFDEAIREGIFPEVSNSFLVLMSKEDRIESFDMKRPLYSRHSDNRDPEYQIRTDILVDGYHKRYVMKYPKTSSARSHLLKMYDTSVRMTEELKDSPVRVNRAKLFTVGGDFAGVEFEYLEGRTLEDVLIDYIRSGKKEDALKIVAQFAAFIRAKRPADLDLIFSNIMITPDGAWNITDYEWIEEGADPEFIIYRSLYYFVEENKGLIPTEELYEAARLDTRRLSDLKEDELALQHKICGDHISLKKMYDIFGKGGVTLGRAVTGFAPLLRPEHAGVYFDTGSGFSEDNLQHYEAEVGDDMRVSFDIPLPAGVRSIRVDPVETACMVRLISATVPEATVNGHVCGRTVIFETEDPQFLFTIPSGTDVFHIEYTLQMINRDMFDDIGQKLTDYETAPTGFLKKQRPEKKEYDKISLLDREN